MSTSTARSQLRPFKDLGHWLATSGGISCAPIPFLRKDPGTLGTLPAVALWLLAVNMLGWDKGVMLRVTLGMFLVGVLLVRRVGRQIASPDDGRITWDELVGYFAAALIAPEGYWWLFAAFVFFRYLDMMKSWPVNWFDLKKTPFYVMMDDVVAGLIAGAWLVWIETGAEWVWGLNGPKALVVYIALTLLNRLYWRYDRQKRLKWGHRGPVPSLGEALMNPVSAWKPWPREGMVE